MILPVNDQYRIAADSNSWSIQENKGVNRETGDVRWVSLSWHADLESAVNSLAGLMIRTSNAQTLTDALCEVERVTRTITHAFSTVFELRPKTKGKSA